MKYPIGIQDFRELRTGGYVYIDKTAYIHRLITTGKYYFLSRPRRFGKSLLVTTLKYLYQGQKELFSGLWIESQHDWKVHPVLHFSFSSIGHKTLGLAPAFEAKIEDLANTHGIKLEKTVFDQKFAELIRKLAIKEGKVVLLIDEYDKPLVDYIDNLEQADRNRDVLKSFFSVLKDSDPFLQLLLITGVSKFSKVSLFSDLNNLDDLTLAPDFTSLVGYSEEELSQYFDSEIKHLAHEMNITAESLRSDIRKWYNGYSWGEPKSIYNPFSILRFFRHKSFGNFWWETGTPTFLIKLLKKEFQFQLEQLEIGTDLLESYTLENLDWQSLLFQTGYLTIKKYDPDYRLYTLGYPNLEVKDAMYRHLLGAFRETHKSESQALFAQIKRSLESGNIEGLIQQINILFSTIPHQIFLQKQEAFFHAVLHLSFSGVGLLTQSEVSTAKGRVDTIVHTKTRIYVMEFKLDGSATSALEQIREKGYGNPYLEQEKEIVAIGINFSSKEKAVAEWKTISYQRLLNENPIT